MPTTGTYQACSSVDEVFTAAFNGASPFINIPSWNGGTSTCYNVTLQAGVNRLDLMMKNVFGGYGVYFNMTGPGGFSFNPANNLNQPSIGSAAFTGCPGSGSFCSSACAASLSGASFQTGYSNLNSSNSGLQSQLAALSNPNSYISLSIPTATNPTIPSFQNTTMWDLRVASSITPSYPYETSVAAIFPNWANKVALIARSNNTNSLTDTVDMAGFSANFARKLDIKYDDGMPYTGNITSGKNYNQMNSSSNSIGTGCTTSYGATWASVVATPATTDYINDNSIGSGCVVGFLLNME